MQTEERFRIMTNTLENVLEVESILKTEKRYHPANQDVLDSLPPDIVRELARRRHEELIAAGYDVPDWASSTAQTPPFAQRR